MGNIKTTMQDIATQLNISRMTVSKAFKDSNDISIETRDKIFQVARELNYDYKALSHSNVLVLANSMFLELDEQFYTKVYKKLIQESTNKNISLTMNVITKEMEKKLTIPSVIEKEIDGLIILGELSKEYLEKLITINLPLIFLDFYNNSFEFDSIITNNYLYSYEITSHLILNGHTRIGFVGNIKSTSSVQDRYLGYYKALLENDIILDDALIIPDRDSRGLLKSFNIPDKQVTAFVCNNDYTAYNLIEYLEKKGYKIPDDISIVGFDDVLNIESKTCNLTTVRVNIDDMVQIGLRRIIQNIGKKDMKHKTYVVSSTIVLRDTVKKLN